MRKSQLSRVAAISIALCLMMPLGAQAQVNIIRTVDTVVSNTNPNLQNTDTFPNGETSLAVNPLNPNEIVISAFSGSWGSPNANAPLWHSTNDGQTWTKVFSIPSPPGVPGASCNGFLGPCDQAFDYGLNNALFGTFLTAGTSTDVYSGSMTNPTNAASWAWWTIGATAQRTNQATSNNADQPWLLRNRGTTNPNADNVFVAYDDFATNPVTMRVSRSLNNVPPQFPAGSDFAVGTGGVGINPGHRLAKDPRNGWMYSLFQFCTANCGADPKTISVSAEPLYRRR